jgi:cytochrome c peroxidase
MMAALVLAFLSAPLRDSHGFPLSGDQTVLPPGTELNEDALERPREVFRSEAAGGINSYIVNLGDLAFNSNLTLGGAARRAGMSCGTCHVNGAGNAKFYMPGQSARPGTFDTTGPLFNPNAHNSLSDAVRIPSLRGARLLAPYGHDGRTSSLRDFVHTVIVAEFDGPEPSPAILDAIVAYIEAIDFLPNRKLSGTGRLTPQASAAAQRGEALFFKPFPHDPNLSCAACHDPSGGFVDHRQHTVGSGGLFKTPTLMNANFNAPYFHDGRYDSYEQVVAHFDRTYELGLSSEDSADLVAYLQAVGDGEQPYERDPLSMQLKELSEFTGVLGTAISAHDKGAVALAVHTIGGELRELADQFPGLKDTSINGGIEQRLSARTELKKLVLMVRQMEIFASEGRFDEASSLFQDYRLLTLQTLPLALHAAQPWSLFDPAAHKAHFDALRGVLVSAQQLQH